MENSFENPTQNTSSNLLKENKTEQITPINWKEYWKEKTGLSFSRKEVFPSGEDKEMSDEKIIEAIDKYLTDHGSSSWHISGIDPEEFPEIIDKDIREICAKLNKLNFLKTTNSCGGHERYISTGEISKVGYSEVYLGFSVDTKNPELQKFLKEITRKIKKFKNSNLPGMENTIIEDKFEEEEGGGGGGDNERIKAHSIWMHIMPTKEWCEKNGKRFINRPSLGPYDEDWCIKNKLEYSENENSSSWKIYEEARKEFLKKFEEYSNEYEEYFRSDEARKLRDEFLKIFQI